MKTIRFWFVGCGVVATMALLVTGCSSGPSKRDNSPSGWSACNQFFGSKNIDALQEQMGEGQLKIENQLISVDDLVAALTSLARGWEPGSYAYAGGFNPCQIAISENGERFTSDVRWTSSPVDGKDAGKWRDVGGDVIVSGGSNKWLDFIFPCKISGTHKGQEEDLPLKVSLRGTGMPKFNTTLRGKLASALARKLSSELGCVNKPAIPREITLA